MIEFMVPVVSEFRSILTNSALFMASPQKKGPVVSRAGVVIQGYLTMPLPLRFEACLSDLGRLLSYFYACLRSRLFLA